MAEHNLLADLKVVVPSPSIPDGPRVQRASNSCVILAPKTKPPLPNKGLQTSRPLSSASSRSCSEIAATASQPRSSSAGGRRRFLSDASRSSSTAGMSASNATHTPSHMSSSIPSTPFFIEKVVNGTRVSYEVHNSSVPCNDELNRLAAIKAAQDRKNRRQKELEWFLNEQKWVNQHDPSVKQRAQSADSRRKFQEEQERLLEQRKEHRKLEEQRTKKEDEECARLSKEEADRRDQQEVARRAKEREFAEAAKRVMERQMEEKRRKKDEVEPMVPATIDEREDPAHTAEARRKFQEQQERLLEQRRELRQAKAEQERKEDEECARLSKEEADRRYQQDVRRREKEREFAEAAKRAMEQQIEYKKAKRAQDLDEPVPATIEEKPRPKEDPAVFRRVWEHQLELKAKQREAEREADKKLLEDMRQNPQLHHGKDEARTAGDRKAQNEKLAEVLRRQIEDRTRAVERARAKEREPVDPSAQHAAFGNNEPSADAKKALQQRIKDQIVKQIEAKKRRDEEEHAAAHRPQKVEPEKRLLLRCPATKRLLPPEAFNVPRTHQSFFNGHPDI